MKDFEEVRESKVGDKIRLFNERNRYNVMARDERYVILSKRCFNTFLYTIFDFEEEWIAPDNLIFGIYDYDKKEDAERALKALQTGDIELSRRRGISFEKYVWLFGNEEA